MGKRHAPERQSRIDSLLIGVKDADEPVGLQAEAGSSFITHDEGDIR
jgi:hypothetical protein